MMAGLRDSYVDQRFNEAPERVVRGRKGMGDARDSRRVSLFFQRVSTACSTFGPFGPSLHLQLEATCSRSPKPEP